MNLALINPRVWLELIVVAAIALGGWWFVEHEREVGRVEVRAQWAAEKTAQDVASALAKAKVDQQTQELQAAADKDRTTKNAQIASLNTHVTALIAGLSERPSRGGAAGVPATAASGAAAGGTGAGLYREDAAAFAGEALRAAKLRLNLIECQAAYGRAEKKLNKE